MDVYCNWTTFMLQQKYDLCQRQLFSQIYQMPSQWATSPSIPLTNGLNWPIKKVKARERVKVVVISA
jgi:hypothetical protein